MKRHIKRVHEKLSTPEWGKILALRTVGNFLILSSIFLVVKTFTKPVYQEAKYAYDQFIEKEYVVGLEGEDVHREYTAEVEKGLLAGILRRGSVEVLVPKDPQFSVVIPGIGANSNVVANVDPSDEGAYLEALKYGVAHAAGSSFPGQGGNIYMFAHSTDYVWNVGLYNAIFYLLYKLKIGDEVDVFYQGQRFKYQVDDTLIVNPDQVEYLTRTTSEETLTLQTCWPPGTTLQRLLIFAKRVAE